MGGSQGFGVGVGQAAIFDGLGGFFYIIVEADEVCPDAVFVSDTAVVIDVQDNIAALGIAVFGLADGADVDSVTVVILAVGAVVKDAVIGFMRMAETHDIGIGVVHDAHKAFFFAVLEQVFIDPSGAAVDQEKVKFIIVQLKFDLDMSGQSAEVGAFVVFNDLVGKGDGDGAVGLFFVSLVGAAAIVAGPADAEVVVSCDGGDAASADFLDDFIGPDIIADKVAEAVDAVGCTGFNVFKKGFKCREVGVDVGEQGYFHIL